MKKIITLVFFAGTLSMIYVMGKTGEGLNKQKGTPHGILNLELAYNTAKVDDVLLAWTASDTQPADYISVAKKNTYWDFLFILAYAPFLYLAAGQVAAAYGKKWFKAGKRIAAGVLVAGLLDAGENIGMLQSLGGNHAGYIPMATAMCSAVKWLLVIMAVLFIAAGGTGLLYRKFIGNP